MKKKSLPMYPPEEGWIKMTVTLVNSKPRSEDELKQILSFGKPDDHEWGLIEQYGAKVVAYCRTKPAKKVAASEIDNLSQFQPSFKPEH